MTKSSPIFRCWYCIIVLIFTFIGLAFLAKNNLGYTGVWYDEAASFWISQGLHNYSKIKEPAKGLKEVISANRYANLDPGGYSILLHYWTKIDKGIVWLRLSAFIFFLVFMGFLGLIAWEWTRSIRFSVLSMALPLLFDPAMYFATEIRAYAMEMAGIAVGTFVLIRVFRHPSIKNLLILGFVCASFLTSRYSYIVFVGSVCCSYFVFVIGEPKERRLRSVLIFSGFLLPVLACGLLIYHFTLSRFFEYSLAKTATNLLAPDYVQGWILKGKTFRESLNLFKDNFLSLYSLPILLAILVLILRWPVSRFLVKRYFPKLIRLNGRPNFLPFYWLISSGQVFSILLSVLGFYPWNVGTRWSLYLIAFSMIAIILLIADVIWFFRALGEWRYPHHQIKGFGRDVSLMMIIVVALASYHATSFRHIFWVDLGPPTEYLNSLQLTEGSVFVTHYEIPTLRYLYEFGPYRNNDKYPDVFRFEQRSEADLYEIIDLDKEQIGYILTPQSPEEISKRIIGGKVRKIENGPPDLLEVVKTGYEDHHRALKQDDGNG